MKSQSFELVSSHKAGSILLFSALLFFLFAGVGYAVTDIKTCYNITSSGLYTIGGDITNNSMQDNLINQQDCILVYANDVSINGQGYTVQTINWSAIIHIKPNYYNITIYNLTVKSHPLYGYGIYIDQATNVTIYNVTAKETAYGIYSKVGKNISITNCKFVDNQIYGFKADPSTGNVTDNIFLRNRISTYGVGTLTFRNNQIIDDMVPYSSFSVNQQFGNSFSNFYANISMNYYNSSPCHNCLYNLTVYPSETLNISNNQQNITLNFTPTKSGLYSLVTNITDSQNNNYLRNYAFIIDGTNYSNLFYFRSQRPQHFQSGAGTTFDTGSLLIDAPTSNEENNCSSWVAFSPDNMTTDIFTTPFNFNWSMYYSGWYLGITTTKIAMQKYGTYDAINYDYFYNIPNSTVRTFGSWNFNINGTHYITDYSYSWLYTAFKYIVDINPSVNMSPNQPGTFIVNYTSPTYPRITQNTNKDIKILSATFLAYNKMSLTLSGRGTTTINMILPYNFTSIDGGTVLSYSGTNVSVQFNNDGVQTYTLTDALVGPICKLGDIDYCYLIMNNGGIIALNYTGYKNFTLNINTVTINITSDGNHSCYNSSSQQGLPYFQNKASGDITPSPNDQITCGISSASGGCDYLYYPQPKILYNTTFCYQNYYINGTNNSNTGSVVYIGADNIIVDGGGLNLIGNFTGNSICLSGNKRVTIQNFNLSNFYRLMTIDSSSHNTIARNITFNNASLQQYVNTDSSNNTIVNNSFLHTNNNFGISISGAYGGYIANNIFDNKGINNSGVGIKLLITSNNTIIENNLFLNKYSVDIAGINQIVRNNIISNVTNINLGIVMLMRNCSNCTFDNNNLSHGLLEVEMRDNNGSFFINNNFLNGTYQHTPIGIYFNTPNYNFLVSGNSFNKVSRAIVFNKGQNNNLNVTNNNMNNFDIGIVVRNASNILIKDNKQQSAVQSDDDYLVGTYIRVNSENITLINSTIRYGTIGVWVQQATRGILIQNTTCKEIPLSSKLSEVYSLPPWDGWIDFDEYPTCIYLGETYKSYFGDSTEDDTDTILNTSAYNASNVVIQGVNYDSNTQVILRTQGAYNYSQDISNYWYKSFQFPTYLWDREEFYINNNFDTINHMPFNNGIITNIFQRFWNGNIFAKAKVNISISKNMMMFVNVNQTTTYNLSLFNLTDQPGYPCVQWFLLNGLTSELNTANWLLVNK